MRRGTHVEIQYWNVDVVEQLGVILDRVAAREEDDDLFLQVLLEESEQQHEPPIRLANHVSLFQHVDGRSLLLRVDVDVERTRSEGYTSEISDLCGLRSGEQHGLSVFCQSA